MRLCSIPLVLMSLVTPARASYDAKTGWIVNEHWLSGVPLGGMGVGKVEVYTDGWFGRATINHNWDRPTKALAGALAVISTSDGVKRTQRTLRLPAVAKGYIDRIPNVAKVAYRGNFPSAELAFRDPALPVKVDLHAWSSLIPNNAKDSSLPVAHLDYTVTNLAKRSVSATLMLGWPNYLGYGGRQGKDEWTSLAGNYQTIADAGIVKGLLFRTKQHYATQRQNVVGEYFMGVINPDASLLQMPTFDPHAYPVTSVRPERLSVAVGGSGFSMSGRQGVAEPCGAVAVTVSLKPGEAMTVPYIVAWAMPTHRLSNTRIVGYSTGKTATAGAGFMLDNDRSTRWRTERAALPGDAIEITLPDEKALGALTLDGNPWSDEYPHGYKIHAAADGPLTLEGQVSPAQATTAVRDGILAIDLRGITAKRVRITNTDIGSQRFWSVSEIRLTDLDGHEVPPGSLQVRALPSEPILASDPESNAGHFWQNSFRNVQQIAAYAADNAGRLWRSTSEWQQYIEDSNLPAWLRRQMVNSAYPLFSNTLLPKDGCYAARIKAITYNQAQKAIGDGRVDEGLEMLKSAYLLTWETNRNPWDEPDTYRPPTDLNAVPPFWDRLNALTGTTLDIPNRTFHIAPHILREMGELHTPVFFPTFWARVDAVPSSNRLTVTILKTFGETPSFTRLMGGVDGKPIPLRWPLPATVGAKWDLSRHWDRLVTPAGKSPGPAD
jgi:hypothetical protein